MNLKACLLTIGTEITDGQIIDSHSQWIAERLTAFGIDVLWHASLPDDKKIIVDFLKKNVSDSDIVVLCGGLGPTSDDLTRWAVAEFLNLPLEIDSHSWSAIQEKLKHKNVNLREGHKQQALMIRGSTAIDNTVGIAPGMHLEFLKKHYFLLPGPTLEMKAVWQIYVDRLFETLNITNQKKLKIWQCTGIPESELAHITDNFFKNIPFVLKTGYRIHKPQIEVKIWYIESESANQTFLDYQKMINDFLIPTSL